MLDDICPYVRCTAAWALGVIGGSRMVEPLIGMLHDGSAAVRYEAASALGKLRDNRFVRHLIPLLEDNDPNVRSRAARTLSCIEDLQLSKSIATLASGVNEWLWKSPVEMNKARRNLWNGGVRTVYSRIGL
jgi:HEAT repeat protein